MKNDSEIPEDSLYGLLKEYSDSDYYPFHMPGHKRQVKDDFLREFDNPFAIDITEIEGFDNLHHPQGILKRSMETAARIYHSDKTYYLVNGSSCGILSAVCAVTKPGGHLLMARNCHKSAYHAVILNQLKPEYIYPQIIGKLGIQGGISAETVDKSLNEHPGCEAVLVVSPTYDGVVSDIAAIAKVVHRHGLPLIVDEAHGAHFPFMDDENCQNCRPALECGADIVVQSLHKTLPSLTQTSVLHVKEGRVNIARLERYLQIFQSSSPSYVFMAAMERCIREMQANGRVRMRRHMERIRKMRQRLAGLCALRLLDRESAGNSGAAVYDIDETKLVISTRGCRNIRERQNTQGIETIQEFQNTEEACRTRRSGELVTGTWLEQVLRQEYHLEMEMAGTDYVVAITTCFDTQEGLDRLTDALLQIDSRLTREEEEQKEGTNEGADISPDVCMTPVAAMDEEAEILDIADCAGRVSAEFVYVYPPGIPILVPGERISGKIIRRIASAGQQGLSVQGLEDPQAKRLRVTAEMMSEKIRE